MSSATSIVGRGRGGGGGGLVATKLWGFILSVMRGKVGTRGGLRGRGLAHAPTAAKAQSRRPLSSSSLKRRLKAPRGARAAATTALPPAGGRGRLSRTPPSPSAALHREATGRPGRQRWPDTGTRRRQAAAPLHRPQPVRGCGPIDPASRLWGSGRLSADSAHTTGRLAATLVRLLLGGMARFGRATGQKRCRANGEGEYRCRRW